MPELLHSISLPCSGPLQPQTSGGDGGGDGGGDRGGGYSGGGDSGNAEHEKSPNTTRYSTLGRRWFAPLAPSVCNSSSR